MAIRIVDKEGKRVKNEEADFDLTLLANAPTPGFVMDEVQNEQDFQTNLHLAEQYHCQWLKLGAWGDDLSFSFKAFPYVNQLRALIFDFSGKRNALTLLPNDRTHLEAVKELEITANHAFDFSEYSALTQLKKLTVSHHKTSSGWLEHDGVVDLTIHKYKADDLTALSKMQSVKRLTLVQSSIKSLRGIEQLSHLETLHIQSARNLTDLTPLLKSPCIENLIFDAYTKVIDWDFLADIKQLKQLNVKEAQSIQFTQDLPNLIFLNADKIHDKNRMPEKVIHERYEALNLPEGTPLPGFAQLINAFE